MTVLETSLKITSVLFQGLDNLRLPFTSHVFDNVDDSVFKEGFADDDDKYFVKSITGLEPPDQAVAIARTASGGKYQGKQAEDREIVVLIGLNPDWDAGETPKFLRDQLYTMINTGYDPKVMITLMSGFFPVASVAAYVTKFEAELFTKDPLIQITFTCLNPTFKSIAYISYSPDDLDLRYPNLYNPGTAETGFQFGVKFTEDMQGWFIKTAKDQNIGMEFDMLFHANDILTVSTIPGSRYIHWHKHRGKIQNKLGILKSSSEWITLHPGMNNFVVPARDKWIWKGKLTFTPLYWGA